MSSLSSFFVKLRELRVTWVFKTDPNQIETENQSKKKMENQSKLK